MVDCHLRSRPVLEEGPHRPYFERYDRERDNEGLINRITDIVSGRRVEVQRQGYTRYNKTLSPRSQLIIEQRKVGERIEEGNQQLADKLLHARPSIGTIQNWNRQFEVTCRVRSNISKFTERRTSKGTLEVYSEARFVPEHYRSFLGKGRAGESPEEEQNGHVTVRVDQLFQLPRLRRLRGSLTRIGDSGQVEQI